MVLIFQVFLIKCLSGAPLIRHLVIYCIIVCVSVMRLMTGV